jgi:hypothetical protein
LAGRCPTLGCAPALVRPLDVRVGATPRRREFGCLTLVVAALVAYVLTVVAIFPAQGLARALHVWSAWPVMFFVIHVSGTLGVTLAARRLGQRALDITAAALRRLRPS